MAGTERDRAERIARGEENRRKADARRIAADRARGRWRVVGGSVGAVAGVLFAALVVWKVDLRPSAGMGLAIPIGFSILYAMGGLRLMRAGEATIEPDWLQSAKLSAESRTFRLLASGTGKYQTWVIDGRRLIDPTGQEHNLSELIGGRFIENHAPAGWSAELKLLFPDKRKVKVAAYERHEGPNQKKYREIYDLLNAELRSNDPGANFKNGQLRVLLLGVALAVVVIGAVIGVGYVIYLFAGG